MKSVRHLLATTSALVVASTLFASSANAEGVTIDQIVNDATSTDDIVSYGLGPQGQRFSPLATVNKQNVKNLVPQWSFSFGGEKQRGQEAQPLVMTA
jgi:alcohol dehydrogenase (cytochrome c)